MPHNPLPESDRTEDIDAPGASQSSGRVARSAAAEAVFRGRLWVALAAVMWSSSGLFAKATTFEVWPAESRGLVLAFWRALFAGVLLAAGRAPAEMGREA